MYSLLTHRHTHAYVLVADTQTHTRTFVLIVDTQTHTCVCTRCRHTDTHTYVCTHCLHTDTHTYVCTHGQHTDTHTHVHTHVHVEKTPPTGGWFGAHACTHTVERTYFKAPPTDTLVCHTIHTADTHTFF